jgi:hypothetical protein
MFADLVLLKPRFIPQGFSIADGILWTSQANNATGNAWVSAYHHVEGDEWRPGGQMAIYDTHGWPLIADASTSRRVGLYINNGKTGFYWFNWEPGADVGAADGDIDGSSTPVPGGWRRITSNGYDQFFKSGKPLFTRKSPGWVQGETVRDDVLLTLRGSPVYDKDIPPDVRNEVTFTDIRGRVINREPVPASIGSTLSGEPIGGRKEHEGLWLLNDTLLIGTAICRKPNYRYQITELAM